MTTHQPAPQGGKEDVTESLKARLDQRKAQGVAKYGQPLMTFDGRTPGDVKEEALDSAYILLQQAQARLMRVGDQHAGLCGHIANLIYGGKYPPEKEYQQGFQEAYELLKQVQVGTIPFPEGRPDLYRQIGDFITEWSYGCKYPEKEDKR